MIFVFEDISILASAGEATSLNGTVETSGEFQFSPLHERQLSFFSIVALNPLISILASAGEATADMSKMKMGLSISILASAGEATWTTKNGRKVNGIFQFSPLHERQHDVGGKGGGKSIFQFSPLHERQQEARYSFAHAKILFQFSPLHERQLEAAWGLIFGGNISILASAGEATKVVLHRRYAIKFQFSPLHERQQVEHMNVPLDQLISILASAGEATHTRIGLRPTDILFQFSPLHERQPNGT